ncbi:hypothetical protein MLD38_001252 [Melastoma candidum]|uniref:Uncharacterized protein n=1 Tax=Melastoma candidum TaxID=119954 RepID=A0ACB9SL94_9MYRT|nr:hypothetical protein MLD38_001252 [Melastoma candidum]
MNSVRLRLSHFTFYSISPPYLEIGLPLLKLILLISTRVDLIAFLCGSQMRSKRPSTCPLCKTSFMCIKKMEDAAVSDQKIHSQTIPHDPSTNDVYVVSDQEFLTNGALVCPVSSHFFTPKSQLPLD